MLTASPSLKMFLCASYPLTSPPGLFPYWVYPTGSSGILVSEQTNYTFNLIKGCSTVTSPSMQNSQAKLSLPYSYPNSSQLGTATSPLFTYSIDSDPRCPLSKICYLNPLYIIHICLYTSFDFFLRRSIFLLLDTKLPENRIHLFSYTYHYTWYLAKLNKHVLNE